MRYRLRTLLIVLALGPPALAGAWFILPTAESGRFDIEPETKINPSLLSDE